VPELLIRMVAKQDTAGANQDGARHLRFCHLRERVADLRGRGLYQGWPNANRAIFVHNPRTAGSSISQALFCGSRHVPYFEYERINPRKFREFFKFAFVRNPWDRLVSAFFYLKDGGRSDLDRRFAAENLVACDNFAAFVDGWLNEKTIWSHFHFMPQHYYICDENSGVRTDFVGRVETVDTDFRFICQRLGITAELQRINGSHHRPYEEYYTDELSERVAAVYARDIAIFGYQFGKQPGPPPHLSVGP
jgi:hypothetical protein